MKRIAYLHIGTPKTGTSAIQEFCNANRDILQEKGVYYPYGVYYPRIDNKHHIPLFSLWDHGPDIRNCSFQDIEKEWQQILSTVRHENYDLLISCETLCLLPMQNNAMLLELKRLFDGFEIVIIIYIRQQDQLLQSLWNHNYKVPGNQFFMGIEDFIEDPPMFLDYKSLLRTWENVFGRSSIVVRLYNKDTMYKGSIFNDFMRIMQIDDLDRFKNKNITLNSRSNPATLEFMSLAKLNGLNNMPIQAQNSFFSKAIRCFDYSHSIYQHHSMLSNEKRKAVLKKYEDINNWVATNYLSEDDRQHFPIWPDNGTNVAPSNHRITFDQIFSFMVNVLEDDLILIKSSKTNISLKKQLYSELKSEAIDINRLMGTVIDFFLSNFLMTKRMCVSETTSLPSCLRNLLPRFESVDDWNPNRNILIVRMAPISILQNLISILCQHDFGIEIVTQESSKQDVCPLYHFKKVHLIPDGLLNLEKALKSLTFSKFAGSYDKCVIVINDVQSDNFHEITKLIYRSAYIQNWFVYTENNDASKELMRIPDV